MKTMCKKILIFLLVLLILCITVCAHPGRTDDAGGHYNRSTGEYHYHHGEPEHQHPNGVCPYDDRYSDYSSEEDDNSIQTLEEYCEENGIELSTKDSDEEDVSLFKKLMRVLVGCWWLIIPIVLWLITFIKEKITNSRK